VIEAFFDALVADPPPMFGTLNGTLRFDVTNGDEQIECWHVTIEHGKVIVSRDPSVADAIVRVHRPLFEDVVAGRANAIAAVLRGDVGVEGNPHFLNVFQRAFPGPQDAQVTAS
jgi:putative sterol carrier protein